MADVKAVILDIDGTLILSNDEHARAFVEAAEARGLSADYHIVRRLIGKGSDKLIPEAFGVSSESDDGRNIDKLKGEIFKKKYLPTLQPAPGARALLKRLRAERKNLIVATSAGKDDVSALLDRAGVRDLIDDIVSSDDVDASKPDPDAVQAAARKSGEDKAHVMMLGDTPYDVEAAQRAGIQCVALRCGGWADADLTRAAAIYDDPADLLRNYENSLFSV